MTLSDDKPNEIVSFAARKEARLLLEILKCSQVLQREINQALIGFGLKYQQFIVLDEIIWNGPVSQKMVCNAILFEKSNLSKIVKLLLDRKLVQLSVFPGDRRSTILSETPEGVQRWQLCVNALNKLSDGYFDMLTQDDIAEAMRLIKKIQKGLKQR